jgi:mitogen-activated protein kinase kinase
VVCQNHPEHILTFSVQAIVDGDPPDLPGDSFSQAAHDFVRGCLNKIPKMRPTYAMLLRHGWLAPLLKMPEISEDEEAEAAAEAGSALPNEPGAETADRELAHWVQAAIERKLAGKMKFEKKPALHEAPLDQMASSPMVDRADAQLQVQEAEEAVNLTPNPGIKVMEPVLKVERVDSLDFAGGLAAPNAEEKDS